MYVSNDILYDDSLENYIKLYNSGTPIKRINPLQNEHYEIFRLANTDIRVIDRDTVLEQLTRLKQIEYFQKDHTKRNIKTGKYYDIKGNKFFYMIPVQSVKGTIYSFVFRRIFDNSSSGNTRYYSLRTYKDEDYKISSYMYGFYKDFETYEDDSKNGSKPIVICEGIKDCIYLKQFYPYVLAMNGSSMGQNPYYLRYITNKILFVSDSDETGLQEFFRDTWNLRKMDFFTGGVKLDKGIKDAASYIKYPGLAEPFKNRFLRELERLDSIV